jgi:hypothetical protein
MEYMLDQSVSARNLYKLTKLSDKFKYSMGGTKESKLNYLETVSDTIRSDSFEFSEFKTLKRNGKLVFKPACAADEFAIRLINLNIKKIFKVKQSDRQTLVEQIKTLCEESCPYKVVKLDIKEFYESIRKDRLVKYIWTDPILSHSTKELVKKILSSEQFSKSRGLPRGISLSATLSEYYLSRFDQEIRELPSVYYSARYVDDIVIFCFGDHLAIESSIKEKLRDLGLSLNQEKTAYYISDSSPRHNKLIIDFLGYRFSRNNGDIKVDISPKKVKKIKSRIIAAFLDHVKNNNFELLSSRIEYLCGNYELESRSKIVGKPLKAGIYYNYSLIHESSEALSDLDYFLRKTIFAKGKSFGLKVRRCLNKNERERLSKVSFKAGFKNRLVRKYTYAEMQDIRKCWTNG